MRPCRSPIASSIAVALAAAITAGIPVSPVPAEHAYVPMSLDRTGSV